MFESANVRPVNPSDVTSLKKVIDKTGLFPSEMLDAMIKPFFDNPEATDLWLTYEHQGVPVALLFCEQERMTVATWNVLAIVVLPALQGQGIGQLLMSAIESVLRHNQQKILLVETSGLPNFARTREFYAKIGFVREARIRDFYDTGEDKIIFWKSLGIGKD